MLSQDTVISLCRINISTNSSSRLSLFISTSHLPQFRASLTPTHASPSQLSMLFIRSSHPLPDICICILQCTCHVGPHCPSTNSNSRVCLLFSLLALIVHYRSLFCFSLSLLHRTKQTTHLIRLIFAFSPSRTRTYSLLDTYMKPKVARLG